MVDRITNASSLLLARRPRPPAPGALTTKPMSGRRTCPEDAGLLNMWPRPFPNELSISAVVADYLKGPGFKRTDGFGCACAVRVRALTHPLPAPRSPLLVDDACDLSNRRVSERGNLQKATAAAGGVSSAIGMQQFIPLCSLLHHH